MADNSVYTHAYRDCALSSTSDKNDIIVAELQHFRIALKIMAGHPEILNEFKKAVMSGSNPSGPAEGLTEPCVDRKGR